MKEAVVVSCARTAIGAFGGALRAVPVVELGSIVMKATLEKIGLKPKVGEYIKEFMPSRLRHQKLIDLEKKFMNWSDNTQPVHIDEVIMGNVLQAAQGQNTARQALVNAGISKETSGYTINKVCGSGLKAIAIGASAIMTGEAEVVLAGGMENMSLAPMALTKARWGHKMEISGKGDICDLMVFDGLYEVFYGYHMGITAENIAELYEISRKEQDELGVLSHKRACSAIEQGFFADEIVPVKTKLKHTEIIFDVDERPISTSLEKMSKLKPVFKKNGTVTAGNSSGINDGAAAVLLMSSEKAKELGLQPLVKIKSFRSGGLDPAYMGLGPVPAIRKVLKETGMTLSDIDMIELNEAFASQAIACMRELEIDYDYPNELGSGISLGHPIGCTGARQVVSCIGQMRRKGYNTGLISMCIGGGMGMAMVIEI